MKTRILTLVLMLTLISTSTFASQAMTTVCNCWYCRLPSVWVNGIQVEFVDQEPIIVDDRTLVPVRGVFEYVGFEVDWNPESRQATLTSDDYEVILTIGSAKFTTNGVVHMLDVPAQIINGRTMLPIRAVLESLGYYVYWDNNLRMVLINSTPTKYVEIAGKQLNTALVELGLSGRDLTNENIEPLRYFVNLVSLFIGFSEVSDMTPIAQLTNLRYLELNNTQISDIGSIAELTDLATLKLSNNQIRDFSPLAELTNLTELTLWGDQINNIYPIGYLENLEKFDLIFTRTTDISALANLSNITNLVLTGNWQLEDITPLANLTKLERLVLSASRVSDITPLSGLTNLTYLTLTHAPVRDITSLGYLINLTSLSLADTLVSDITPLTNLTNLTWLSLPRLQNDDLTPLAYLTNLTFLVYWGNADTDWSPVAHVEDVIGRDMVWN